MESAWLKLVAGERTQIHSYSMSNGMKVEACCFEVYGILIE